MSDEQDANRKIAQAVIEAGGVWKGPTTPPPRSDAVWNAAAGQWFVPFAAIATEREECAKIAELWAQQELECEFLRNVSKQRSQAIRAVAQAIRARTP